MATNEMTTPALVAEAMKNEDRSLKWTAERSGIAISTLRRKLAGGSEFTTGELIRIGAALRVHPADLLPTEFARAA